MRVITKSISEERGIQITRDKEERCSLKVREEQGFYMTVGVSAPGR